MTTHLSILVCASALLGVAAAPRSARAESVPDAVDARGRHFIHRSGGSLYHRGRPFRVAGASNYYPMYVSHAMVDDLLASAAAADFNVMRFWGALDIGRQDGTDYFVRTE